MHNVVGGMVNMKGQITDFNCRIDIAVLNLKSALA